MDLYSPGHMFIFFVVIIYLSIYFVHRKNVKKAKNPSVLTAVLLSLFFSPPAGFLYVKGLIAWVASLIVFIAIMVVVSLSGQENATIVFIILAIMSAIATGVIASQQNSDKKSSEQTSAGEA